MAWAEMAADPVPPPLAFGWGFVPSAMSAAALMADALVGRQVGALRLFP